MLSNEMNTVLDEIGTRAADAAMRAAVAWVRKNRPDLVPALSTDRCEFLLERLRVLLKHATDEALADAKVMLETGNSGFASAAFTAPFVAAGIESAKDWATNEDWDAQAAAERGREMRDPVGAWKARQSNA